MYRVLFLIRKGDVVIYWVGTFVKVLYVSGEGLIKGSGLT